MRGFKIEYIKSASLAFTLCDYRFGSKSNLEMTYNENLQTMSNSQYELTFNFNKFQDMGDFSLNLVDEIKLGGRIRLTLDNSKQIDMVITSVSPSGIGENITYNASAKDVFSFQMSRNNVGLQFDSFEDDLYLSEIGDTGNSLSKWTNYLLRRGYLQTEDNQGWRVTNKIGWIYDGSVKDPLLEDVNVELSNSNTYNALVEAANLTNSEIEVDYQKKEIYFLSREHDNFKTNMFISPKINAQDIQIDYQIEEFFPILYAFGGEDEYGLSVGLVPYLTNRQYQILEAYIDSVPEGGFAWTDEGSYDNVVWGADAPTQNTINLINKIPYLDTFIINLDYYVENGLLTEIERATIMNSIYDKLRRINIKFQNSIQNLRRLETDISRMESEIEAQAEVVAAWEESNYSQQNEALVRMYKQIGGTSIEGVDSYQEAIRPSQESVVDGLLNEDLFLNGYVAYRIPNSFIAQISESTINRYIEGPLDTNQYIYNDTTGALYLSSQMTKAFPPLTARYNFKLDSNSTEFSKDVILPDFESHIFEEGPYSLELSIKSGADVPLNRRYLVDAVLFTNISSFPSGTEPVDNVDIIAGQSTILVVNPTLGGIYGGVFTANSGSWTRKTGFTQSSEMGNTIFSAINHQFENKYGGRSFYSIQRSGGSLNAVGTSFKEAKILSKGFFELIVFGGVLSSYSESEHRVIEKLLETTQKQIISIYQSGSSKNILSNGDIVINKHPLNTDLDMTGVGNLTNYYIRANLSQELNSLSLVAYVPSRILSDSETGYSWKPLNQTSVYDYNGPGQWAYDVPIINYSLTNLPLFGRAHDMEEGHLFDDGIPPILFDRPFDSALLPVGNNQFFAISRTTVYGGRMYNVATIYKYSKGQNLDSSFTVEIESLNVEYDRVGLDNTYKIFNYFSSLYNLNGNAKIKQTYNRHKTRLTELIKMKKDTENALAQGPDLSEGERRRLESDLEMYIKATGSWRLDDNDGNPKPDSTSDFNHGKFSILYKYFKDYGEEYYKNRTNTAIDMENIPDDPQGLEFVYTKYIKNLKEKQDFWYQLKNNWGQFLYEGYYENTVESSPHELYNQAIMNSQKYQEPQQQCSVQYIDISDVIGADFDRLKVGDRILIRKENFGVLPESMENKYLQITEISTDLRNPSGTQLVVNKTEFAEKILEKLIKGIRA